MSSEARTYIQRRNQLADYLANIAIEKACKIEYTKFTDLPSKGEKNSQLR